ncbi:kynurenine formamidase isoform X2 [Lingula anatina]|uniref:Kynurenine formamidase n=1 Tax=Lingula anatina TaxID=7574 RepID=A0A1S3KCT5_LINAN|nr:kynurenine formamidase isoform X2 [Lingula anatina]|eukprot:XP_013420254.1 kynurenine formamidase isoform X2 [Lingula anatina]
MDYMYKSSNWSHRFKDATQVVPNHKATVSLGSERARQNLEHSSIVYGESEEQKVDVFYPSGNKQGLPIFVYIHGGYWQDMSLSVSSFMAETFVGSGAIVAVVGYDLAPKVNMGQIINQVKKALGSVMYLAKKRESSGVYICGHSAGAHLAAMMLSVDWMGEFMESPGFLKGVFLVSGIFDLRPLVATYVNEPLKMTDEEAWTHSPMNHLTDITCRKCKVVVLVAEHDSPEFRKQAKEYHTALQEAGMATQFVDVPGVDHFDVVEKLSEPQYQLTQLYLEMMGIQ